MESGQKNHGDEKKAERLLYNPMKIIVNLTPLNDEQIKFLSQLGEFQDDHTWESECDPDEFQEAIDLLKNAGIDGVYVQFGDE